MQLAQQLDRLILVGRRVTKLTDDGLPDIVDRALTIHLCNEAMGGRAKTMGTAGCPVLQYVPALSTVMVAMNFCMAA